MSEYQRMYPITEIWEYGNWGDVIPPVLKEFPRCPNISYNNLKRVVLISPINKLGDEENIGRGKESRSSNDLYDLNIKMGQYDDLVRVFNQMREIIITYLEQNPSTSFYSELRLLEGEYSLKKGKIELFTRVQGFFTGKIRPVFT